MPLVRAPEYGLGALRWEQAITDRIPPEQAPALFARINRNEATNVPGAVIRWSDQVA